MTPIHEEDDNGRPRPIDDLVAALKFVQAEIVTNPIRMGARNTGPAVMHLVVIREILVAELERRQRP